MEIPYDNLIKPQVKHFVNYCLTGGSLIKYIPFNTRDQLWPGWCNPSIMWDEQDQEFKMILRNVNHLMHNSGTIWAQECRLLYSNPQEDGRNLKTTNWIGHCKNPVDEDFEFTRIIANTYQPIWEFQGEEDARIVRWDGNLIATGVRRDNNTKGIGRMEVMFLDKNDDSANGYHQGKTFQIKGPNNNTTYCEKNWMPIKDKPYHYMRIANPTIICKTDMEGNMEDVMVKEKKQLSELDKFDMIRGSSQVIPWKDKYITLVHTCEMWWTANDRKVARYLHAFILWDKDYNILQVSPTFSFADYDVEFSCGLEYHNGTFYIPFAIHDNIPFLLMVPENVLEKFIEGDKMTETTDKKPFDFIPQDCRMLKLKPSFEELHNEGVRCYQQHEFAKAYAIFMRIVDNYDRNRTYNDLFMAARCVADLSHRDNHELSMWYHVIEWDPNRPEGYLALAMYYYCRWKPTSAIYWMNKAYRVYKNYKGKLIFYSPEYFEQIYKQCKWQSKDYNSLVDPNGEKQNRRAF